MILENCPNCQKRLSPPFRSSNRQVCVTCGWTNKPSKKNVSADQLDDFANNTTDSNKFILENKIIEIHKNLLESTNLSTNELQEEVKLLIVFLHILQWNIVVILIVCGLIIMSTYNGWLGVFSIVLVTPSYYFSIQTIIIVIKLISRIEINTRSN